MQRNMRASLILLCECLLSRRVHAAAALIALCLFFSGCTLFHTPPPLRDEAILHIKLVDNLPHGHYGLSTCADGICSVLLRRDSYPYCLGHEVRHAFEDDWHGGQHSVEDCR